MMRIYTPFLALAALFSLQCCTTEKPLVPRQAEHFVNIYKPAGDKFFGPTTEYLEEGKWYDEWVPNDHTFVRGEDGRWHIFGITHPEVLSTPLSKGIHDGEFASFHAVSEAKPFASTIEEGHYKDLAKILTPYDRMDEILPNHAPYVITKDGEYVMVYGHSPIRVATSKDLAEWTPQGEIFEDSQGARDPNILFHDGVYYITYCSMRCVKMVSSTDMKTWSKPKVILKTNAFDPESPSLLRHNDTFYLIVCAWDGKWDEKEIVGAYQHNALVFQSDDLSDFGTDYEKQITQLKAHAPEFFQGEDGQWYISSVEWPHRGVSIDKLYWE